MTGVRLSSCELPVILSDETRMLDDASVSEMLYLRAVS